MTKRRILEIHAQSATAAEAKAQIAYKNGFEYYLKAGHVDNGDGLAQVFDSDFMRGFLAAARMPAELRQRLAPA